MKLKAQKLSKNQAQEISKWQYPNEYAVYNLPTWDIMLAKGYSLTDDQKKERYIGYVNNDEELVGFVNLLDKGESVFFWIGIKSEYCNMGIGKIITKMALIESESRFPNKPIVLEVRAWNKRAIKCYQSQGFKIIEIKEIETPSGVGEFYVMKYKLK